MIKLFKKVLACLFLGAACGAAPLAQATDFQDAWFAPGESGWGVNIVQTGTLMGLAVYVYDQTLQPTWYLGSGTANATGTAFSGAISRFNGPWFGGAFNPALVTNATAGTFTFTPQTISTATLAYTVNGVNVTKNLQRLAVAKANMAGDYLGTLIGQNNNCSSGISNNFEVIADFTVTQSAALDTARVVATFSDASTCTFDGAYSQEGRYGRIHSNYTCSYGDSGTMDIFEIESGTQGFSGRLTGTLKSSGVTCTQIGRIGGMSRAQSAF